MATTQALVQPSATAPKKRRVPQYLIRETLDGIPLYYKGYRSVLNKKKTAEDIIAYSSLQSLIIEFFTYSVLNQLDRKRYWRFIGETGNHLSHRSNLSLDIAVFSKAVLNNEKITNKYADVPPKLVIEVDLKVEWENHEMMPDVVSTKTQRLLEFGTEKVIWVFSSTQKIMVAELGKDWVLSDWNKEIELIDGVKFNLGKYLDDEGIKIEPLI
jgi:Uma2 family endonuclease